MSVKYRMNLRMLDSALRYSGKRRWDCLNGLLVLNNQKTQILCPVLSRSMLLIDNMTNEHSRTL